MVATVTNLVHNRDLTSLIERGSRYSLPRLVRKDIATKPSLNCVLVTRGETRGIYVVSFLLCDSPVRRLLLKRGTDVENRNSCGTLLGNLSGYVTLVDQKKIVNQCREHA